MDKKNKKQTKPEEIKLEVLWGHPGRTIQYIKGIGGTSILYLVDVLKSLKPRKLYLIPFVSLHS